MAKMSKRGQKIKSLPKAKASATRKSAMEKTQRMSKSAVKPKSRGAAMASTAAAAADRIVKRTFMKERVSSDPILTRAEKKAMSKAKKIVATRIASDRSRANTRVRSARTKEARISARKAVTGR